VPRSVKLDGCVISNGVQVRDRAQLKDCEIGRDVIVDFDSASLLYSLFLSASEGQDSPLTRLCVCLFVRAQLRPRASSSSSRSIEGGEGAASERASEEGRARAGVALQACGRSLSLSPRCIRTGEREGESTRAERERESEREQHVRSCGRGARAQNEELHARASERVPLSSQHAIHPAPWLARKLQQVLDPTSPAEAALMPVRPSLSLSAVQEDEEEGRTSSWASSGGAHSGWARGAVHKALTVELASSGSAAGRGSRG